MKRHLIAFVLAALFAAPTVSHCGTPQQTVEAGWTQYRAQLLKDQSLLRCYLFDEPGNEVRNIAGNKVGSFIVSVPDPYFDPELRPGTNVDFPRWTEGRFAGKSALEFGSAMNGAWRCMFYRTSTGALTLESWVRIHDGGDDQETFLFSVSTGRTGLDLSDGWFLKASPRDLCLQMGHRAAEKKGARVSAKALTPHVWHHVVAQIEPHALRLFVDGALAAKTDFAGTIKQPPTPGGSFAQNPEEARGGLKIGPIRSPENTLRFDCDELAVYDRIITEQEVREHFEKGQPKESAGIQTQAHLALLEKRGFADQIILDLPKKSYGYFPAGKTAPLTVAVPAPQAAHAPLSVSVAIHAVNQPPQFQEEKTMPPSEKNEARMVWDVPLPSVCGLYQFDVAVKDATGAVLAAKSYPIGTTAPVPPMSQRPATSPLAGHNILDTNNDLYALGAVSERLIPWRPKNPEGDFNWKYSDQHVEVARKLGMDLLYCESPRFDMGQVDLNKITTDPTEWENWVRAVVERFKGRVKYWEILNEPNAHQIKPDQYVAILKTAHRVIRELDPEAKIVGLCGVSTYPEWTESILAAGGGGYFDILAFHNYIGSSPISAWQRDRKIERTKAILTKYLGKEIPIWNTESGIHQPMRKNNVPITEAELYQKYMSHARRENGITLVSADAVTMASEHVGACWQTQSILLDCALGVQRYYMLMGPSYFYLSTKGSGNTPAEKGVAYAAMASVLNSMKSMRLLPLSTTSSVGVTITSENGGNTTALFADVPTTRCFAVKKNGVFRGMDFLGNPLTWEAKDNLLTISFGMEPVYVFDVPDDFGEAPFLSIKDFPALVSPGNKVDGVLSVTNLFSTRLSGRLEIASAQSTVSAPKEISLAPGERRDVPFKMEAGALPHGNHSLMARLLANNKEIASSERHFASEGVAQGVPMLTTPIVLDADASEWSDVPEETADTAENVVIGKPPVGYYNPNAWQGPKDLSFAAKVAWRPNDGIYLFVNVTNDIVKTVPPEKLQRACLQDALELFFDGRSLKDQSPVYSFGAEQHLLLPAIRPVAEPCLHQGYSNYGDSIDVEFVSKRTPTGFVMEGRIRPKANSPFKLVPGARFGMDLMVDDAAEAEMTRKAQMALHGNADNSKNTSNFGRYCLLAGGASASPNLLRNTNFNGGGNKVEGWKFTSKLEHPQTPGPGEVKSGVKVIDGKRALWISPAPEVQSNNFWTQTFPATENTGYCASFRLKGEKTGKAKWCSASGSVIFLGKAGEFLGYQALGSIRGQAMTDWGTFNKKFITPPSTASVGFRFGSLCNALQGNAEFYCTDISVSKP